MSSPLSILCSIQIRNRLKCSTTPTLWFIYSGNVYVSINCGSMSVDWLRTILSAAFSFVFGKCVFLVSLKLTYLPKMSVFQSIPLYFLWTFIFINANLLKVKPYFLVFKKETEPHNSRGKKELAWTAVLYVRPLAYFILSFKNNNNPCKWPRERTSSNMNPKFPLRRLIPHRVPQKVTLAQFKCGVSISPLRCRQLCTPAPRWPAISLSLAIFSIVLSVRGGRGGACLWLLQLAADWATEVKPSAS